MLSGMGSFGHLGAAGIAGSGGLPPPVTWNPQQLPSLLAFYDATAVFVDGSNNVTDWLDNSPNQFTLNPTGTPPVYSDTSLNGKPGITWSSDPGGNSQVNSGSAMGSRSDPIVSVVAFFQGTNNGTSNIDLFGYPNGPAPIWQDPAGLGYGQNGSPSTGSLQTNNYYNDALPFLDVGPTCVAFSGSPAGWDAWVNFAPSSTGAPTPTVPFATSGASIFIGPAGSGSGGGTLGSGTLTVGYVVFSTAVLTSTDINNLRIWTNSFWGTTF